MSLPVLLAVEEDPDALREVETQLVQRYGRESATDADVALGRLPSWPARAPKRRWCSQGSRLQLQPMIRGLMAMGRIDHYVLSPTGSRDEVFHEAVSSFLLEWARDRRSVPQTVHIVGDEWSGRAYELRTVFEQCAVPHAFWLADSDKGRELVSKAGEDAALPLMALPDGRVLCDPTDEELAEAAGAPADLEAEAFDVVIVGAGPAGLSAAVGSASEGLSTLVVDEGGIGGKARSSPHIRNYLGFAKGVSGARLAEQAYEQALGFGAQFLFMHRATGLKSSEQGLELTLADDRRITARAIVLASGASYKRLDVPALDALSGFGVFYGGPASEAPGCRGKEVYVNGGGNSAGQAALHLARFTRAVTLVVRAQRLDAGMSQYLVRAVEMVPNVVVHTDTEVVGGGGDGRLQELVLRDATGEETTVAADALFVLIGAQPHTEWLPTELARDEEGFILTGSTLAAWRLDRPPLAFETSIPRVFAAGDARSGSVKRVASAVGEGSIAAQLVHTLFSQDAHDPNPVALSG